MNTYVYNLVANELLYESAIYFYPLLLLTFYLELGVLYIHLIEQRKATIRATEREIDEADEIVKKIQNLK